MFPICSSDLYLYMYNYIESLWRSNTLFFVVYYCNTNFERFYANRGLCRSPYTMDTPEKGLGRLCWLVTFLRWYQSASWGTPYWTLCTLITAPPTLIKKRARASLKRLDFFEGSSELLANLLQFSQTLKVTHLLVAWHMTICGVHVCAHSIHWRLPRKIKGCNLVIKKRRHCMGLGEPLPSGRGWLPSLQECRRLRISASSYFRISLRLKGRLYWLVTFIIYPTWQRHPRRSITRDSRKRMLKA